MDEFNDWKIVYMREKKEGNAGVLSWKPGKYQNGESLKKI